ncbi:MAG: DUF4145 domain-containing protein [Sedimentisphaerales bacterium]
MNININDKIVSEIDELVTVTEKLSRDASQSSGGLGHDRIEELSAITSRGGQLILRLYGKDSQYQANFQNVLKTPQFATMHSGYYMHISQLLGILRGVQHDIKSGMLSDFRQLFQSEIFADFIALAKEVLDDNKDVAVVLACAALEDSLKRVAIKENLNVDDKDMSDIINALKTKGVIKGAQVPIVQSYVKLRNKAFHAEWDKIDKESVSSVIGFTEQFILSNFS